MPRDSGQRMGHEVIARVDQGDGHFIMMARAPSLPVFALLLVGGVGMASASRASQAPPPDRSPKVNEMKVRIQLEGRSLTATLDDNAAAREFLALLPLSLTLTDYNSTEKVADLPKKLSTQNAPAGIDPEVGDLAYYAPWGNLAIFYRDFAYSSGLVKLGRLDSGAEALSGRGPLRVTITRAERVHGS